jgi:hypothetical protein
MDSVTCSPTNVLVVRFIPFVPNCVSVEVELKLLSVFLWVCTERVDLCNGTVFIIKDLNIAAV